MAQLAREAVEGATSLKGGMLPHFVKPQPTVWGRHVMLDPCFTDVRLRTCPAAGAGLWQSSYELDVPAYSPGLGSYSHA